MLLLFLLYQIYSYWTIIRNLISILNSSTDTYLFFLRSEGVPSHLFRHVDKEIRVQGLFIIYCTHAVLGGVVVTWVTSAPVILLSSSSPAQLLCQERPLYLFTVFPAKKSSLVWAATSCKNTGHNSRAGRPSLTPGKCW